MKNKDQIQKNNKSHIQQKDNINNTKHDTNDKNSYHHETPITHNKTNKDNNIDNNDSNNNEDNERMKTTTYSQIS